MLSQELRDQRKVADEFRVLRESVADWEELYSRPVDILYVVCEPKTGAATSAEYDLKAFYSLIRGTKPELEDEYTVFLSKTAADEYAARLNTTRQITKILGKMNLEDLSRVTELLSRADISTALEAMADISTALEAMVGWLDAPTRGDQELLSS